MRILITGATGFVGKELCRALALQGHSLVVIARKRNEARYQIPAPHDCIEWDFVGPIAPSNLCYLKDLDAVVHLAGEPIIGKRWAPEYKKRLHDSRVRNTKNLLNALESQGKLHGFPKVFITASAVGIYGDRKDQFLTEDSAPGDDFLAKLCQEWEGALFESGAHLTFRKVALRFGIVLGKGGGALSEMLPIFSSGLGGRLGDGSQWMSWIHISDLISVIQKCIETQSLSGPINCTSPNPVTNQEFTRSLNRCLHQSGFLPVPEVALKVGLGEVSTALLSSQRVTPKQLMKNEYTYQYPTIDSALHSILGDSYALGYWELSTKTWIAKPIKEVFKFFSDASNLERITPPWLNFRITSQSSSDLHAGALIDYSLKLHGIPLKWKTEIASWNPPHEFTDIQLKGPYKEWRHKHQFTELAGGTLMEDQVLYRLPLGALGKLAAGNHVKKDVHQIFSYRSKIIDRLMSSL